MSGLCSSCPPPRPALYRDAQGRTVLLRGVNLSVPPPAFSSVQLLRLFLANDALHRISQGKQPPNQPSHDASWHLDKPSNPDTATEISFVGAPFPLDEAQVHIARLKA
jgi:hypothetical protein